MSIKLEKNKWFIIVAQNWGDSVRKGKEKINNRSLLWDEIR